MPKGTDRGIEKRNDRWSYCAKSVRHGYATCSCGGGSTVALEIGNRQPMIQDMFGWIKKNMDDPDVKGMFYE